MKNSKAQAADHGVETIPGMGIVRIRCLRKAGWSTVESLKDATVEEIAAVPGIGDAKAREIRNFLDTTGARTKNGAAVTARARRQTKASEPAFPDGNHDHNRDLGSAIARVSQLATDLLSAPISHSFDRQLARQVGRVAALSDRAEGTDGIKAGRAERALKQLRKMESLLTEVAHEERLAKKRRERMSEELRDRRRKVWRALPQPKIAAESA